MPRVVSALILAVCLLTGGRPHAISADTAREYQVKAAFLYNVLKFVEWPPAAMPSDGPLTIAVIGTTPLTEVSSILAGKSIKGHPLDVQIVSSAGRLRPCHVLFVTADAAGELRAALRGTEGQPVLTISEETVAGTGTGAAVIALVVADAKLAFHVNLDAAEARGLQLSANLLDLAKTVHSSRLKANRP